MRRLLPTHAAPSFLLILLFSPGFHFSVSAQCLADPAWFPGGVPDPKPVDPYIPLPKDTDECDFYKVAWQTFLYITHPDANNIPRFLSYAAPIDLFQNQAPAKLSFKGRRAGGIQLLPRNAKTTTIDGVLQATSNGLLVDHAGRAVYSGTHLNDVFVGYIKSKGFDTDVKKIATAGADAVIDPGSLELKSTWKILDPKVDDASTFFTTKTEVPVLDYVDDPSRPGHKKVVLDLDSPPRTETLALVGLHVVLTVKDHPEFIWASFEHYRNAPGLASQGSPADDAVEGIEDYTFYDAGTSRSRCNFNAKDGLTLNPATQIFSPVTQVQREFKYGNRDDATSHINRPDPDVNSLNQDVRARLKSAKSVWQNYFLIGAIWINDPDNDFVIGMDDIGDEVLRGETRLSNSTIETFTQPEKVANDGKVSALRSNCFRCHTAGLESRTVNNVLLKLPGQKINVSHVLKNAFFRQ